MPRRAPGLPDPRAYGDIHTLPEASVVPWVVQEHKAQRAGRHLDVRFGPDRLFSFATKKELPGPGGKIMLYQQPLHTGDYADFEGKLPEGYGKGTVKTKDRGSIYIIKATPDKVLFTLAHRRHGEQFALIKKNDRSWLLVNITPTVPIEYKKVHYKNIPHEEVEKVFDPKYLTQAKIDGAAAFYKLLENRIQAVSYRAAKGTGYPIVHSFRIGGLEDVTIPPRLVGTVLRGEIWGERKGEAIPPQELGGILNASIARSLKKQQAGDIRLRNAVFNIMRYGKGEVPKDISHAERQRMLADVMRYLPKDKFHLPRQAETPEESKQLWEDIVAGKEPQTREGVVAWPVAGGRPAKVKLRPEHDVWIKDVVEGTRPGTAGSFTYSLSPDGPVAGRVGTGFDDATRADMWANRQEWSGRMARIRSEGRFPSGAYRAPSFIALHEDYPSKTAAATRALRVGGRRLDVEIAKTAEEHVRGLSGRDSVSHGMLFVYPWEEKIAFWMRNTQVPLSVAFIKNGRIIQIEDMEPLSLDKHEAKEPVQYALEVPRGWFEQNSVKVGASVSLEDDTMAQVSKMYRLGYKMACDKPGSNNRTQLVKAKDLRKAHEKAEDPKKKKRSWIMPQNIGRPARRDKMAEAILGLLG